MNQILEKTFGGLSKQYYIRQFIFGVGISVCVFLLSTAGNKPVQISVILFSIISTILYPYSRFVYESIVDFIMGDNVFFVNILWLFLVKYFTMMLCWGLAIFIAPVGLAYLYYHHSKEDN